MVNKHQNLLKFTSRGEETNESKIELPHYPCQIDKNLESENVLGSIWGKVLPLYFWWNWIAVAFGELLLKRQCIFSSTYTLGIYPISHINKSTSNKGYMPKLYVNWKQDSSQKIFWLTLLLYFDGLECNLNNSEVCLCKITMNLPKRLKIWWIQRERKNSSLKDTYNLNVNCIYFQTVYYIYLFSLFN